MLGNGMKTQLQPLVRSFVTSSQANGGLLSAFGIGCSRVETPLSEALTSVAQPPRNSAPATKPAPQVSALSSGAKLATVDTVSPVSSLAIVVEGGSAAETAETVGASKVLEAMAFKATSSRTTFRLTRELEKIGATAYAKAGRDSVTFGVDCVRVNTNEAVEILTDAVLNARGTFWEVRDTLEQVKEQLGEQLKNPAVVLDEVLHRAAFEGGLGNTLVVDPAQLASFTNENLHAYLASVLDPSRMVLAGVGVEHGQVKALANPLVSGSASAAPVAASKYVGGNLAALAPGAALTHVAVAFEAKGGASCAKGKALSSIVKALLEEARPTLPHNRVEHEVFASVGSFSQLYKSSGLVGVTASAVPSKAGALVDAVCKKFEVLAKGVSESAVANAKAKVLGEIAARKASTSTLVGCLSTGVLYTGAPTCAEVTAAVESATAADVSSYVSSMVKSAPTFAAYGALNSLPRVDISKRF